MDWLYKILFLIVLAIVLKLLLKGIKKVLPLMVKTMRTRYRIQGLLGLSSGIIFCIIVIYLFAQDFITFAIPFSVLGAGIAFALQELIASIAGRIVIVASNLYQIGDRIQIGEMRGDVISIGFLRTSLMEIGNWVKADQYTGRIIHVTNSTVLKDELINYSATFPFVWDEVIVPVRYGSDQHLARKLVFAITDQVTMQFQKEANKAWLDVQSRYMIEESNFTSIVTLVANDNWLEFTARYIVPAHQRRLVKDKLCTQYVDAFEQHKDKVQYASMTIEITSFPAVKVDAEK